MKKNLVFFLILITFGMCFAMSKAGADETNLDTVTGRIKVYGNEPFAILGIITDDGLTYTLKAEKDVLNKIQNAQGHIVQIKGKVEIVKDDSSNQLKNGYLIVLDWKIVK